jgi:hypothetical protein
VQKPTVPESIQVPAGEELVFMARATGFQIYVCRPDADGKPVWTLKAPEAELFDEQGKPIGKHFGGPTWQLNDGSQVDAKMAAKADAPDPKAIPWLLLTVTGHSGNGKLSGVTSIQRVNTVGGLAPSAAECTAQSGVQEQLFRRLLLLRAAMNENAKPSTRRKRVNGGITNKNPNSSAPSVPLCFKGFDRIRDTVAGLNAGG